MSVFDLKSNLYYSLCSTDLNRSIASYVCNRSQGDLCGIDMKILQRLS